MRRPAAAAPKTTGSAQVRCDRRHLRAGSFLDILYAMAPRRERRAFPFPAGQRCSLVGNLWDFNARGGDSVVLAGRLLTRSARAACRMHRTGPFPSLTTRDRRARRSADALGHGAVWVPRRAAQDTLGARPWRLHARRWSRPARARAELLPPLRAPPPSLPKWTSPQELCIFCCVLGVIG